MLIHLICELHRERTRKGSELHQRLDRDPAGVRKDFDIDDAALLLARSGDKEAILAALTRETRDVYEELISGTSRKVKPFFWGDPSFSITGVTSEPTPATVGTDLFVTITVDHAPKDPIVTFQNESNTVACTNVVRASETTIRAHATFSTADTYNLIVTSKTSTDEYGVALDALKVQ